MSRVVGRARSRAVAVIAVALLAAGVASVPAARALPHPDFIRVHAVAGPGGASVVNVVVKARVRVPGPESAVAGVAVGLDFGGYLGGAVEAVEITTLGATLASTGVGGDLRISVPSGVASVYDAEASFRFPTGMLEGDRFDVVAFYPGAQVEAYEVITTVGSGVVTSSTTEGWGSKTITIGDETTSAGSSARAVNGLALGTAIHRTKTKDGLVGTMLDVCTSCRGSWSSRSETNEWEYPAPQWPKISFPAFAGDGGEFTWTWSGTRATTASSAVIGVWFPAADWAMFMPGPDFSNV